MTQVVQTPNCGTRQAEIERLKGIAREIRADIVKMIAKSGSGHPGGSLSAADVVTALYFHEMKYDPANPKDPDRDRFILSKGHCCPVHYSALARAGFFGPEHLDTLRQYGSILQGHSCMNKTPGVDMTSGSLGMGISIGAGMALGAKLDGRRFRVFVMTGDGEMQEGSIWEALMAAPHFRLDNLCVIIDKNGLQVDGTVDQIMPIDSLDKKLEAFGWNVIVIDGHDMDAILDAFDKFNQNIGTGVPTAIIANTIKGKGVSFMENQVEWHGLAPSQEQRDAALSEIEGRA